MGEPRNDKSRPFRGGLIKIAEFGVFHGKPVTPSISTSEGKANSGASTYPTVLQLKHIDPKA